MFSLGLLCGYTFKISSIQVNEITLALLGILLIIPLLDDIDSLKIGSIFEAKMHKKIVESYEATSKVKEQYKDDIKKAETQDHVNNEQPIDKKARLPDKYDEIRNVSSN